MVLSFEEWPVITQEELSQLKEAEKKATPGPWNAVVSAQQNDLYLSPYRTACGPPHKDSNIGSAEYDAEFIALSRNLTPKLIAEIEALRAEKAKWEKAFNDRLELSLQQYRETIQLRAALAAAREALDFCATNDFKIEKTQSVASEALKQIEEVLK